MAVIAKVKKTTIPNGGGTSNIDPTDPLDLFTEYLYTGTGDLTSSYTIAPTGTILNSYRIRIIYAATLGLNGNNITIFGVQLSEEQARSGAVVIEALYNTITSAWVVTVMDSTTIAAQRYEGVKNTTLTTGGGTINLDPALNKQYLLLTGSGTLTASWTIQGSGTPKDGAEFFVKYNGTFTPDGNAITIFGISLTDPEITAGDIMVHAYYNLATTTWSAQFIAAH